MACLKRHQFARQCRLLQLGHSILRDTTPFELVYVCGLRLARAYDVELALLHDGELMLAFVLLDAFVFRLDRVEQPKIDIIQLYSK